jgi:hypothetical protein
MLEETRNEQIIYDFNQLIPTLKKHGVSQLNAVFLPYNSGLSEKIKDLFNIKSGLYLLIGDEPKEKLKESGSDFDFIKLHGFLGDPLSSKEGFESIVDKCVNIGYNRFQLHTSGINDEKIMMLEKYVQSGIKFYLVHGADAIKYSRIMGEKLDTNKLKELKGNIFLGTSSFSHCYFIPLDYVTDSINLGLEKMLCFETDHVIQSPISNYKNYFKAMKETMNFNEGIFENNVKEFLTN